MKSPVKKFKRLKKSVIRLSVDLRKLALRISKAIAEANGKRILTLDIDSTSVRLVEIKGRRIRKWGSVSFRQDDGETGFADSKQLSSSIKELFDSCHIRAGKVIVSISGLYSINRVLELPATAGKRPVQPSVMSSMKDRISLNMDELYTSWEMLGVSDGIQRILAIGVPRDIVDVQMQALKTAGIRPRLLELRTTSLVRAIGKEKAIILNIEQSSFDIVVVAGGMPSIIRTLAWRREDLSGADGANHLASALELTVNSFNDRYLDDLIDPATPIFITGQMSGDHILMEELQARLNYPVQSLAPPLDYSASLSLPQYAANIGLALRGLLARGSRKNEYPLLNIDLLPEAYRPWKPTAKQLGFVLGLVGCIAIIASLYQSTAEVSARIGGLEDKYSILNNELQRRQDEIKNRVPLQKVVDDFRLIQSKSSGFTEDIELIYSEAEEVGIGVKSVVHEGKSLTVAVEADNYELFRKYADVLKNYGRFSGFVLPPEGFPFTTSGAIKFSSGTASSATPTPTPSPPAPSPTSAK